MSKNNRLELALVCFRAFELLYQDLYSAPHLDGQRGGFFFEAKFPDTAWRTTRLVCLRTLTSITLEPQAWFESWSDFNTSPTETSPPLHVGTVHLEVDGSLNRYLGSWTPLLSMLDPESLVILRPSDLPSPSLSVSTTVVPSSLLEFAQHWDRLQTIEMHGEGTVPVLDDREEDEDQEAEDEEGEERDQQLDFHFALPLKDASISFLRLTTYEDGSLTVGPSIVPDVTPLDMEDEDEVVVGGREGSGSLVAFIHRA